VTKPALAIIKAAGVKVQWETQLAGAEALKRKGTTLPKELMDSFEKRKIALKGPVTTPVGEGFASVNVELRQTFDLYANLRPVKNLPGVKARYQNVDLIIVRENTEGLYSGIEHEVVPGVVESLKIMTERASTRIAKFAFDYARSCGRKKVVAVHKANILKLGD
jgi:isocitrate dehydrogenase (NAD+)